MKKVTVIIPIFNTKKYLERCVNSVRNQSYQNVEIVLVDDGSCDGSSELCDELAERDGRIVVIHQNNSGASRARYNGLVCATGDYVAFVDSDDWIEPVMIEDMVSIMRDSELVSVGYYFERENDVLLKKDDFLARAYNNDDIEIILSRLIIDPSNTAVQPMTTSACNKLFRTDKAREILDGIDHSIIFGEDVVFTYLYLLKCNSISISDKYLYHYCYRCDSLVHSMNINQLENINKVYCALYEAFKKKDEENQKYNLLYQLQRWVLIRCSLAVNERMGFDKRVRLCQYAIDLRSIPGNKIIIYGAGRVGRDMYAYLDMFDFDIVCWVDRCYVQYQKEGLSVSSIELIKSLVYDSIIIAIENEKKTLEVKNQLIEMGVCSEKIIKPNIRKMY